MGCRAGRCLDAGRVVDSGPGTPLEPRTACSRLGFGTTDCTTCWDGLTCMRERLVTTEVDDAEGGSQLLEVTAFPEGLCTMGCESSTDCGTCAVCVPHVLAGRARLRGPLFGRSVCRPRCDRGCPLGSACDAATGACLEACSDDAQCAFVSVDTDGDGLDDMLRYAPEDRFACVDGQCRGGAGEGDPCFAHDECAGDMVCPRDPSWDAARPGQCARRCTSCLEGESCVRDSRMAISWCAPRCVVGADAPDARLGRDGHGEGCPDGFRCEDDGGSDDEGACAPGNYNDVTEPNIGAVCETDDECFSPYGRGRCLRLSEGSLGQCSVVQCFAEDDGGIGLLPDVIVDPAIWCDPALGLACRAVGSARERTACVRPCGYASECPEGWACPLLQRGRMKLCTSECFVDTDCRSGEQCRDAAGGGCALRDRGCTCRPGTG